MINNTNKGGICQYLICLSITKIFLFNLQFMIYFLRRFTICLIYFLFEAMYNLQVQEL